MRKINNELWLLLFLVLIAAVLNFLVGFAAHGAGLLFPARLCYSAYYFGRRHATLTACASVFLVVLLTYLNPVMFSRKAEPALRQPLFRSDGVGRHSGRCRIRHGHAVRAQPENPA